MRKLWAVFTINALLMNPVLADDSMTGWIDTIAAWGLGISGGASLFMCKPQPPATPFSFYLFNSAAVAYWMADTFVSETNDTFK